MIGGMSWESSVEYERIINTEVRKRLGGVHSADLLVRSYDFAEIEAGLKDVMSDFNNAEAVKKVKILGEEWLPDSQLLTPTSKLKRRGIHARFAAEIERVAGGERVELLQRAFGDAAVIARDAQFAAQALDLARLLGGRWRHPERLARVMEER